MAFSQLFEDLGGSRAIYRELSGFDVSRTQLLSISLWWLVAYPTFLLITKTGTWPFAHVFMNFDPIVPCEELSKCCASHRDYHEVLLYLRHLSAFSVILLVEIRLLNYARAKNVKIGGKCSLTREATNYENIDFPQIFLNREVIA